MKIKISKATLAATRKCGKNFSCIDRGGEGICKVKACVADKAALIECAESLSCDYKVTYGDAQVCTCPTRIEIYKHHRI